MFVLPLDTWYTQGTNKLATTKVRKYGSTKVLSYFRTKVRKYFRTFESTRTCTRILLRVRCTVDFRK